MEKNGIAVGIIGGLGLGLLLGVEYSSRYVTIVGAILVVISILIIILLSRKK